MEKEAQEIKKIVRAGYAKIAQGSGSCCGQKSCCGGGKDRAEEISKSVGYSNEDMSAVPEGANLGLGCGNPVALASLKNGDCVLDLGSGAGFDAFLASQRVGAKGHVIGVDMTHAMIDKATQNAKRGNFTNVEFRLGEIEKLPVESDTIDVIISNCVINLSPDKESVFKEAYRVLKPGGRLMVSDLVLVKELPASIKKSVEAYVGCLAGAILKKDYLGTIEKSGFQDIAVVGETYYPIKAMTASQDATATCSAGVGEKDIENVAHSVVSIKVSARKG